MKKKQIFHDAYNFADNVVQGKLEHFQLETGAFYGELTQIITDKVIVGVHSMNLSTLQIGTGIKGYITFLLPKSIEQKVSWKKFTISEKQMGVIRGDGPHFAITPSNFIGFPVSIKNDYFTELFNNQSFDEKIFNFIQQSEMIVLKAEDAFKIQKILITLNKAKKVDIDLLTIKLPELLIKAIVNVAGQNQKKNSSSQQILLSKVLIFIQENLNRKISTIELCNTFNISERNLRYIFKEIIGVSPMKYIKIIKLNKTRKYILNAKKNIEINLIANKWGFNHSGQFASDYKKMFGEFPSDSKSIL